MMGGNKPYRGTKYMAATAKTEVKKRGDGPVVISYVDADNKTDHKRVPANVHGILLADRHGKNKSYSIDGLPVNVRQMLIGLGLKRHLEAAARNGADDTGTNVIALADAAFTNLKEGKIYTRIGGGGKGGPGRTFDADIWVEVVKRVSNQAKKPATEKQLTDFRTKITSYTSTDRSEFLKKLQKDPRFKVAYMTLRALKSKGEKEDALSDLF